MAIDLGIFGLAQVPQTDLIGSLQRGLQARQTMRQAPLLAEIQRAQLAQAQQNLQTPDSIQQAVPIPGVGFQTLTRGGQVGLRQLSQEQQSLLTQAAEEEASRRAEAAGLRTRRTEEEKLNVQLDIKPRINAAVRQAEISAQSRGETLSDLARSQAALPGLKQIVNQLREVSPFVTSTTSGRIFDKIVLETGFGSTKGATSRAKFLSIVDNQILPLLKQTFGGAFTAAEGDALKATLGDVNIGHQARMAQLDSFIDAKTREIESKQRGLEPQQQPTTQDLPEDFSDLIQHMTPEERELFNGPN
jgi:hypothetical protein